MIVKQLCLLLLLLLTKVYTIEIKLWNCVYYVLGGYICIRRYRFYLKVRTLNEPSYDKKNINWIKRDKQKIGMLEYVFNHININHAEFGIDNGRIIFIFCCRLSKSAFFYYFALQNMWCAYIPFVGYIYFIMYK